MFSLNTEKGVITLKQSERSFRFKKNYLVMREDGKSVQEIADYHNLSHGHAYKLIRELAEERGEPYESLLPQPHSAPIILGSGKLVEPVKPVDFSGFEQDFREGISSFDKTLYQMDKILKEWPAMPEDLKEV